MEATFEYGVAALGVHTILILGHSKCGAGTATLEGKPVPGNISILTRPSNPALIRAIRNTPTYLQKAKADGKLRVMGAVYDVETGNIRFLN
jgi:carbonic anhydrase